MTIGDVQTLYPRGFEDIESLRHDTCFVHQVDAMPCTRPRFNLVQIHLGSTNRHLSI